MSKGYIAIAQNNEEHDYLKLALDGNRYNSRHYYNLNGQWKFQWAKNPFERSKTFFKTDFNDDNWDDQQRRFLAFNLQDRYY